MEVRERLRTQRELNQMPVAGRFGGDLAAAFMAHQPRPGRGIFHNLPKWQVISPSDTKATPFWKQLLAAAFWKH
jgi:hypothetical protein